ncbi:MAG: C-GCAxxG-C-C family protein [Deltaproteobacteria bacterium]|jgi:C_GCAxxG_C_C family probable redox protein|nr:C-GCAxxG-C-C family protein [Deltaproteobacteria bacterium]
MMSKWLDENNPRAETLVKAIGRRAGNLYLTRQLLCTEAVLITLNKAFDGGLSESQALTMAAPFSIAMGESGCLCGALSGAVLACGLFVGKGRPYLHRKEMRRSARQLHDAFKAANGATCCRVLSRSVRHDEKAHFQQCARLTEAAATIAARLILYRRPDLMEATDNAFLHRRDHWINVLTIRLRHWFSIKK